MDEDRTGWRPPAIVRNRGRQAWYGWAVLALSAVLASYRLLERPDATPVVEGLIAFSAVLAVVAGALAVRGYRREQASRR